MLEYIHVLYAFIGFFGQGIHFRGLFLSRIGHDRLGGHNQGGHRWSKTFFIMYGHVACLNIGN